MISEIPRNAGPVTQPSVQAPQPSAAPGNLAAVSRPGDGSAAVTQPPQDTSEGAGVQRAQAEDLAQGLQRLVQSVHRQLSFKVDDGTGTTVIQVIDSETDEVVRQIPSEAILTLQRRLAEIQDAPSPADKSAIDGMLLSTKA